MNSSINSPPIKGKSPQALSTPLPSKGKGYG